MRKLIYHVAITVDGFIAHADGTFDGFPAQGDHVDDYLAALRTYGAVIMGRHTYEVGLRAGVSDPYPWLDTFVVSRTMKESPDPRVTIVTDAPSAVRELKQREGADIYLCGGARLASALLDHGLVDEVLLKVNPILFGAGIPLTRGISQMAQLELSSLRQYESGVLLARYAVRG